MCSVLLLASASPRRRKILRSLGVEFRVAVPAVDEALYVDAPQATVEENARRKADWARQRFPTDHLVAADTVIDFAGRCITKPGSRNEAAGWLRMFSGREHAVLTAVALGAPGTLPAIRVVRSVVRFKRLDDETIRAYLTRVDPLDKAGGYDIDQHGDMIVAGLQGSRSNVMGLPGETVREWLRKQRLA